MKKNVVIVILVMLVLGLGGYLVYDKVIDKGIEKESKEETAEKEYDLEEAKKLVDNVIPTDDVYLVFKGFYNFFEMDTEDYKQLSVLDSYNGFQKLETTGDIKYVECDNLSNNFCNNSDQYITHYIEIDYDKVNEKYHSMFGSNSDMPKKDIKRGISWYEYDDKNNKFIQLFFNAGTGGEYLPWLTVYKVKTAKIKGEKLVITLKAIELELNSYTDGDTYEYYYLNKNYKLTKDGAEMTTKDYENIKEEILEKEEESLGTYEMTFIKENGKYYYSDMIRVY